MFADLMKEYGAVPIRGCPGRYVLRAVPDNRTVDDILGEGALVQTFRTTRARDTVLVARIEDGGVISYQREDGTFLHTLNTREGFERKLLDLGIELGRKT